MKKREAEELLELSRKATPGPWTDDVDGVYGASDGDCEYCRYNPLVVGYDWMSDQDRTFVVAARNRVDALVQMLQQAGAIIEVVNGFHGAASTALELIPNGAAWLAEWNKPEPAKRGAETISQDTERETKHTPGPMNVGHDGPSGPIILCADGSMLSVSKFVDGRWITYDQEEADAVLFAAAPDLLSDSRDTLALFQKLLGNLKYIPDTDQSGHPHGYSVGQIPEWEIRQKIEWLEKSIAKAEGCL